MQRQHRVQGGADKGRGKKVIEAVLHDTDVAPDVESAITKQIKRFGGKAPDRLVSRPTIPVGLAFFVDAFWDLDTERSLVDLEPIPWSKIVQYGAYYRLGAEMADDLLYLIRRADNAYLRRMAEKRKRG